MARKKKQYTASAYTVALNKSNDLFYGGWGLSNDIEVNHTNGTSYNIPDINSQGGPAGFLIKLDTAGIAKP